MNLSKSIAMVSALALCTVLGINVLASAQSTPQQSASQNLPKHVAGKIASVSHQKVKVGSKTLDQIEVTVSSCLTPGKLETVVYTPSTDSDRSALGHLFEEDLHSARTADMPKQQLPNGYGVFWVDANNHVTRTGLLGAKMSCQNVPAILGQF